MLKVPPEHQRCISVAPESTLSQGNHTHHNAQSRTARETSAHMLERFFQQLCAHQPEPTGLEVIPSPGLNQRRDVHVRQRSFEFPRDSREIAKFRFLFQPWGWERLDNRSTRDLPRRIEHGLLLGRKILQGAVLQRASWPMADIRPFVHSYSSTGAL
eukprot:761063-Hanusia_phi.AAC.4